MGRHDGSVKIDSRELPASVPGTGPAEIHKDFWQAVSVAVG
jgi:hypothetical protein